MEQSGQPVAFLSPFIRSDQAPNLHQSLPGLKVPSRPESIRSIPDQSDKAGVVESSLIVNQLRTLCGKYRLGSNRLGPKINQLPSNQPPPNPVWIRPLGQ
ncbi:hypothetical protein PoB_003758900 [Plakobranchus ocellatus]|uniref:Uncharacterized protein n=1 Tax=Plakobranchus ocellatus TaxID=259542 RepID=A0AAV4AY79_9GAST|nr:hypothetical protein PoB_003758900 [Plakobranchus ocellatus]